MKSKPNFEVDIIKPDGKTLSFSCSYIAEQDEQGSQEEGFGNFSLKILKHSFNFEVLNFFSTNFCEPRKENELYCKLMRAGATFDWTFFDNSNRRKVV